MTDLIKYIPEKRLFFLQGKDTTYVIQIIDHEYVSHLYWGPTLAPQDMSDIVILRDRPFSPNPINGDRRLSLDSIPLEFPSYGTSDYRSPAIEVYQPLDGSRIVDFRYKAHRITSGKPALKGLPSTYVTSDNEAATLVLELEDTKLGLRLELAYTVFARHAVMTRSVCILNHGSCAVKIRRILSSSVDFSSAYANCHFLHLSGTWARECDVVCSTLRQGIQSIDSKRGATGHQQNPFFALAEHGMCEEHGNVFGFNLIYSGNFLASVELDSFKSIRAQIGLNPFDFEWTLDPGACFQTPEVVQVYSDQGLGGMSRRLHRFYREHLIRREWVARPRPVLVNSWEATYFDFDSEKLEEIAKAGAGIGLELFVLDDGWFGRRNDDSSSLGDWFVDCHKLPGGLADLAKRVNQHGLEFGLWFEPEMVSPNSNLYRMHPDWCLHVPGRSRTEGRNQLILDLSQAIVRQEIQCRISNILRSAPITYVKWDMNRNMTEIGSSALPTDRQQETAHRYMLGLYEMMEYFIREFPHILFEGCSGGGGRFDPGILHYMPQIWTSDNSDAISRLRIQYGTSVAYPWSTISAHVSAVPNHQIGRITSLRTRGHVALAGAFGYELDLSKLSSQEKAEAKDQIEFYKKVRNLLLEGDLYRIRSPFNSSDAAWIVVSQNKREAVATHIKMLAEANPSNDYLPLRGLDPNRYYRVSGVENLYRGDLLMNVGLPLEVHHEDFTSNQWHLISEY